MKSEDAVEFARVVAPFLSSLASLLSIVKNVIPKAEERTVDDEKILIALSTAYTESRAFFVRKENSVEAPLQIAHAWETVAVLARKYDPALAHQLAFKARYWREGACWSAEVIKQARIGLEEINRAVRMKLAEE